MLKDENFLILGVTVQIIILYGRRRSTSFFEFVKPASADNIP